MADQSKGAAAASPSAAGEGAAGPLGANLGAQKGATKSTDAAAKPAADLSAKGAPPGDANVYSLLGIEFNAAKSEVEAHVNPWVVGVLIAAVIAYFLTQRGWRRRLKSFDIEK